MDVKSVWVIEKGTYSDYQVVGVYSSKENAQVVADHINRDDPYDRAEVDEWTLDRDVEDLRQNKGLYLVVMAKDGTVERCDAEDYTAYSSGDVFKYWDRPSAPAYKDKNVPPAFISTQFADNDKHAIKIANERRLQWLASND